MKRRDFLKLMGLASSTTAISACGADRKAEKLIPYLVPPDDGIIPGVASYVSSTCTECPAGCGVQVKVREELPVKLEGLPGHPVNDSALCVRGQASLSRLYNADRLRTPMRRNAQGDFVPIHWDAALEQISQSLLQAKSANRTNVYLAGRTTGSLSLLIDEFCEQVGVERLPEYEVFSHATLRAANDLLFGHPEVPMFHIEDADFLLTLGADILETFVSPVAHTRQLAQAKKLGGFHWTHVEPHVSLSGLQASERLVIQPGTETYLLNYLLHRLQASDAYSRKLPGEIAQAVPRITEDEVTSRTGLTTEALDALLHAFELADSPLLIVGGVATAHTSGLEVAVLAGLVQWLAGMTDRLVDFSRADNAAQVGTMLDLAKLSQRLGQNEVGVLFITRTDPLTSSGGGLENLSNASLRVGLSSDLTETMNACDLILPLSHAFESWGDSEPREGLRTIVQPAMKPIFDTRSEGDILFQLMAQANPAVPIPSYQEYLFGHWGAEYGESTVETLVDRGYATPDVEPVSLRLKPRAVSDFLQSANMAPAFSGATLIAAASIRTFDGRSRALPLLSEIPDPLTTITYGNWISVPVHGEQWEERAEVELSTVGGSVRLPVKNQPGLSAGVLMAQADQLGSIALPADERTGEMIRYLSGVRMTETGASVPIPILSGSSSQDGRGILPGHDHEDEHAHHGDHSMYEKHPHEDYRWGMAIDLESCIGCSACVAACYVENNVAIVGSEEHLNGREMSWLRIEPFYEEDETAEFLPMMCQQCDNAPCEPVCPVYATYHTPEGLNAQVYNRCVGTRYCANNCPYKVRRFNWFTHLRPMATEDVALANPDVSVRSAGIMEKCTFCVQRIRAARDTAKDESRKIEDGDVTPACAQTCPTQAITFGNLDDSGSRVSQLAHSDRAYRVFEQLGTQPAVHYLKKKSKTHEA